MRCVRKHSRGVGGLVTLIYIIPLHANGIDFLISLFMIAVWLGFATWIALGNWTVAEFVERGITTR